MTLPNTFRCWRVEKDASDKTAVRLEDLSGEIDRILAGRVTGRVVIEIGDARDL